MEAMVDGLIEVGGFIGDVMVDRAQLACSSLNAKFGYFSAKVPKAQSRGGRAGRWTPQALCSR